MLSRNRRLTTKLFDEVMKSGGSQHVSHFSLRVNRLNSDEMSRFSFSVPKKVAAHATDRNRLRRQMVASVQTYKGVIPVGFNSIVFAKKASPTLTFLEIKEEIYQLLQTAFNKKIINN